MATEGGDEPPELTVVVGVVRGGLTVGVARGCETAEKSCREEGVVKLDGVAEMALE
jgi:hypothetical protein